MRRNSWCVLAAMLILGAGPGCSSDDGDDTGTGDTATTDTEDTDTEDTDTEDTETEDTDTEDTETEDTDTEDTDTEDTDTEDTDTEGTDTEDTGDSALEELADAMSVAICDRVEECFYDFPGLFEITDCASALQAFFADGALPQWEAAVEAGTAKFNADQLQACLDAVGTLACGELDALPDACGAAIEGLVEEAGDCVSSVECAGSNYCVIGDACPGVCTAPTAAGEACAEGDLCAAGSVCFDGTCTAAAAAGEACGADNPDCGFPLVCAGADDAAATAGTCVEFGDLQTQADGEACDALTGQYCEPGLYCLVDAVDGDGNISFVCGAGAEAGGACKPGLPDPCPAGEICMAAAGSIDGTCTTLPGAGEACLEAGTVETVPLLFCAQGLLCDPNESTCVEIGGAGDACTDASHCVTGSCTEGVCDVADPCP